MAADLFDEFDFKPLTEGLGFHKKAEKIKADIRSSQMVQEKITRSVPEAPPQDILARRSSTQFEQKSEKRVELSMSRDSSGGRSTASQSISDLIASLPPSLDFINEKDDLAPSEEPHARPQIFQPLGREDYIPPGGPSTGTLAGLKAGSSLAGVGGPTIGTAMSHASSSPLPNTMGSTVGAFLPSPGTKAFSSSAPALAPSGSASSSSPYRERLDQSFARAFPHTEKGKSESVATEQNLAHEGDLDLIAVPAHFGAGVLDTMVAAGITTILLVAILAITRINLIGMLSNPTTGLHTKFILGLLFLAVVEMYFLAARSLFSASLGEWAFDLQVGTGADQTTALYPVKVAWRTTVVILTGFILAPLFSMIFRRDLLRYVTGLQIYRRP